MGFYAWDAHPTGLLNKKKSGAKLLIICRIRASFGVGITVPVVIDIMPFTSMPPTVIWVRRKHHYTDIPCMDIMGGVSM